MPDREASNLIAEWFGYRVYPIFRESEESLQHQQTQICPFLTAATRQPTECIKPETARGVCTVSSTSNGSRQDWLVCPQRTIFSDLVVHSAMRLFQVASEQELLVLPAPTLQREDIQRQIQHAFDEGKRIVTYFQEKLGGEVSLRPTDASPELSFDFTMVELLQDNGEIAIGYYGILELQTMDFHGSYRHAVSLLRDALRLHEEDFADAVRQHPRWLSQGVEGPNVANVFKRTFYQMVLKFTLAEKNPLCMGAILTLPQAVWDSWKRHLGNPQLFPQEDGTYLLEGTRLEGDQHDRKAWICIFDIDAGSETVPNPIVIRRVVSTDAKAIAYYALEHAAEAVIAPNGPTREFQINIRRRLHQFWPSIKTGDSQQQSAGR